MSFAIVAEFPLGFYRGRVGERQLDPLPSPARLHAALVSAAAKGTSAVEDDGALRPSDADHEALEWLECNPPDGLVVPNRYVARASVTAYRDLGLLRPGKSGVKKVAKSDQALVALAKEVMWVWEREPPEPVRERLDALCPDVPYLGQSDSLVRLRTVVGQTRMTHRRDPQARLGGRRPNDIQVMAPRDGRTAALSADHQRWARAAAPTVARDKVSTDESELRTPPVAVGLAQERYVTDIVPAATPWQRLWLLPLEPRPEGPIPAEEYVRWCVALHRALIAVAGDEAPEVLTGAFAPAGAGTVRPANRVALQVLDRSDLLAPAVLEMLTGEQALVVAVPAGASASDAAAVDDAVRRLRQVRRTHRQAVTPTGAFSVPGDALWTPPPDDMVRVWRMAPTLPDARRPRGKGWSLEQAVAHSVAMVFRDQEVAGAPAPPRDGLTWDEHVRAMADWALKVCGVGVYSARKLATASPQDFVHKVQAGTLLEPVTATLTLGAFEGEQAAFVAVGQPRHLGGGLLVPVDVPPQTLERWATR